MSGYVVGWRWFLVVAQSTAATSGAFTLSATLALLTSFALLIAFALLRSLGLIAT